MPTFTTHLSRMPVALLLATALACGSDPSGTTTGGSTTTEPGTGSTQTSGSQATTGDAPTSTTDAVTSSTGSTGGATTGVTSSTADGGDTEPAGTSTDADTTGAIEPGSSGSSSGTTGDGDTIAESSGDTGGTSTTGDADGLGEIMGDCGLIDAMEVESPAPFVFNSAIDFGMLGYDYDLLTPGGQQIADEGGLNDGSLKSEIVAYEVLARCDMAALLKTEGKIIYKDPMGKKTDLLVELADHKVGVSVVRAVGFPKDDPYTVAQADTILKKKLSDIKISSANVAPEDAWIKQILSVVAYGPMHAESIVTAYEALDPTLKADTILVVSVTNGDDAFIYN
ncbi:MAG TPA: hypothetical protein VGB85_32815 [Nannocystis sp.]